MSNSSYTYNPFNYTPSIPLASVFLGLFTLTTVWHIYQIIRWKSWYLTALIICGILEVAGFSTRLVSIQNTSNTSLYSAQYAFLVLAPIFLAASVYVMLGRIIAFVKARSLIPGKWIAYIFVTCDIISFIVQIAGAIILLNRSSTSNYSLGKNILIGGLAVQVVTFTFFIIIAVHFDITVAVSGKHGGKWRWLMTALYIASGLILARSIYRVIDFSGDTTTYLATNEWPLYVLDASFIFISMVIFNIIYPAKYLSTDFATSNTKSPSENEVRVNGKSPVGVIGRSPIGVNGRSPVVVNGKSPVVVSGRSPVGVNGGSTGGVNERSTSGVNGRSTVGVRGKSTGGVSGRSSVGVNGRPPVVVSGKSTGGVRGKSTGGVSGRSAVRIKTGNLQEIVEDL